MEKLSIFKTCDATRKMRHVVPAPGSIASLLEQGSCTFKKRFTQIVLENDGCQITSDLALNAFTNSLLMLLTHDEIWTPNITFATTNESYNQPEGPTHTGVEQIVLTQPSDYFQNAVDTESTGFPFLHQVQLAPNVVTLISNPQEGSSAADPIAMQMLTDMEHQVQQSGECSEQFNADSISTQDVKTVTNLQPNNEEANRNADLHDENCSPNTSEKRTIHEQPGYQTKKQATSSKKFDSFEVNWTKLSDNLLSRLNSLQNRRLQHPGTAIPRELRLKKHEMASLVNTLVDQLRAIDTTIRADIMESVSKQVLLKYPCLEILDDDGFGDGLSHKSLKQKLVERNSYLNRLSRATGEKLPANQKHRNRRAGTIQEYWKTTTDQCSKETFSKLRRDEPSLLTEGFLNESQAFVRSRFDQNKDLKLILSELPVLRRQQLLNFHFKQATGIDIGTLRTYFTSKRAKIVDYSTSQKAFKLQSTSSDYEVFDFLAKSVGEDLSDLVLKKEIGTGIDDVREESAGPVIICIDIGNGSYLYYVFANQARVTEGATDIVGALQDLMCVQYVHSFMYMKPVAKFLELVQEYFLKIFPTKGSKSSATRIGKQQRLVKKVIASLSNHGLPLDEMVSSTV